MMEIEDREDEWGSWECPVCGADHEDPSSIVETTCGTCNTTVTLSYPDDDGRIIAYVQSQREKAINEPEIPINFCDEFDVPRQAYRDIAKQLDTLKRQLADIRPVIEALADMDSMWRKSIPSYAQDPGHHVIDCLTYGHLQVAGEWMKKYGTGTAVPNEPDPPYRQRASELAAERDALRKLIEDLKLGAECYLTAVADLQAGYTPDTHPDWNAVQYLAGEAHAAILRANDVLGVDAGGDTAVPNEPDPPYPHRTRVCSGCGTAVDEDDLADGNLCHICIKR